MTNKSKLNSFRIIVVRFYETVVVWR